MRKKRKEGKRGKRLELLFCILDIPDLYLEGRRLGIQTKIFLNPSMQIPG
jgi:hypothetical protein